jgi:hypothetical protein
MSGARVGVTRMRAGNDTSAPVDRYKQRTVDEHGLRPELLACVHALEARVDGLTRDMTQLTQAVQRNEHRRIVELANERKAQECCVVM